MKSRKFEINISRHLRHVVAALERLRRDGLSSGIHAIENREEAALCAVFALADSILNHPFLSLNPGIRNLRGAPLVTLLYGLIRRASLRMAGEIGVPGVADNPLGRCGRFVSVCYCSSEWFSI